MALQKALELEKSLPDGKFLNGNHPGEEDKKAFQALLGKDNVHLWRWVKHMLSYSEEERKSWPAPVKVATVNKSSLVIDVKPWDDETDMTALEAGVRAIEIPGLHWGASKLVKVAYGIQKLQIMLTIEDDKVSTDDVEDAIVANEDYVQSMDIVAFNKL